PWSVAASSEPRYVPSPREESVSSFAFRKCPGAAAERAAKAPVSSAEARPEITRRRLSAVGGPLSADHPQRDAVRARRSLDARVPPSRDRRPAVRAGPGAQPVADDAEAEALDQRPGALRAARVLPRADAPGKVPGVHVVQALRRADLGRAQKRR